MNKKEMKMLASATFVADAIIIQTLLTLGEKEVTMGKSLDVVGLNEKYRIFMDLNKNGDTVLKLEERQKEN